MIRGEQVVCMATFDSGRIVAHCVERHGLDWWTTDDGATWHRLLLTAVTLFSKIRKGN